jgi:2-polyprenyl-3-methyl-5-hydroxy-6-metoxy-1,4-benzoquinol methylase
MSELDCLLCGRREWRSLRELGAGQQLVECRACRLVRVSPFPASESLRELYTSPYFRRVAGRGGYVDYDAAEAVKRPTFERLLDEIGRRAPARGRLLDVGAATGLLLDLARARGYETAGIEPNPEASESARARGHLVVTGLLPGALDGVAGDFDVITLLDVLEHLPDPLAELGRLRTRLREGGLLVAVTPDWGGWFRPLMGAHWPHLKPEEHLWYFRRGTLEALCRKAGFRAATARRSSKTTSLDYLLADFAKHTGPVGAFSRALAPRLPRALTRPVNLFLDEMVVIAER